MSIVKTLREVKGIELLQDTDNPRYVPTRKRVQKFVDDTVLMEMVLEQRLGTQVRYINTLELEV